MTARIQGALGKLVPKSQATETMARIRRAIWLVLAMLGLSLLLVVLGVYTTTRTESVDVMGYTSGVILTLGSFLGLLGLCLKENCKQLLTAAILFLSVGIVASFLCVMIDGVCIVLNMDIKPIMAIGCGFISCPLMLDGTTTKTFVTTASLLLSPWFIKDMRPLKAERCQHYSSGSSYIYENFYTSVSCWSLMESCNITVRSGTCYCCDLYDCANGGYLSNYYEFVGVHSCGEVFTVYVLIWILTGMNLVAFFAGILTTAVLGSMKDLRDSSPVTKPSYSTLPSPTAPLLMDANTHAVHQLHPVSVQTTQT